VRGYPGLCEHEVDVVEESVRISEAEGRALQHEAV
jgi:hypothetical protein